MAKRLLELSDSSDEDVPKINVNTDFAKNYDNWRRKEELQKLKDKYGDNLDILSESEQSFVTGSEDSEESETDSEESVGKDEQIFDDNFFKVYSALKSKNPIIYDKNVKFFDESKNEDNFEDKEKKKNKEKTMTLIDYHKKLIKEKKGVTDEDLQQNGTEDKSSGYYQELDQIRNEFKTILNSDPTEGDSDEELFKGKTQTVSPQKAKRVSFLDEEEVKNDSDLKYLNDYWKNDKQLEESEKYLKDYIINRRYLDKPDEEDEELYRKPVSKQTQDIEDESNDGSDVNNGFETIDDMNKDKDIDIKISDFHFEEPDSLSLKRFPRNIETIRDTTTAEKRALKRSETKERKKREKEKELKRLRKLKKQELRQKLAKIQEISGNDKMDFNDLDLNVILDDDKDFDSEKYDQKMSALFGNHYYSTDKSVTKPKFEYMPEIDDFQCENTDYNIGLEAEETNDKKRKTNKLLDKKQKKITKTMEEIGIFEDLIGGDLATRYKYRSVESNDFGLTDEEILFSDDKELNKWCSLKKMSQYRDDNEEKYDKKSFENKAKNIALKKKVLKSYFEKQFPEQNDGKGLDLNSIIDTNNSDNKKRKKRRHKKPKFTVEPIVAQNKDTEEVKDKELNGETVQKNKNLNKNKRFKRHKRQDTSQSPYPGVSVDRLKAYGLSNRKIKKIKHKNKK